jgi:hypothetical protein
MATEGGQPALFYDSTCGPCTFFASVFQGVSRTQLAIEPLDSPDADQALGLMEEEERFGAFHFMVHGSTFTGPEAMTPLVETTFGQTVGRIARDCGPVRGGLRRTYLWFWEYRRTRGCAADRSA